MQLCQPGALVSLNELQGQLDGKRILSGFHLIFIDKTPQLAPKKGFSTLP